ncbi:uncharacterized protein LTR77_000172 [Saxophila tyrrhenica]|uniref:NAD(P)-binding protein n=1 Tax=Saxophila tyrrhenica TaxID=1690608 RepID=A0AAV9PMK1_9PEZI|nr:hypothetical protein LTR77_000172 [Saxophila tyrrhenica]
MFDARYEDTWLVVGASRGIGHEFVQQLLDRGNRVYATVRKDAASFWPEHQKQGLCRVWTCDITSQSSIENFVDELSSLSDDAISGVIINAGVLKYPSRATEMSFDDFTYHLNTNAVGPIICAQALLKAGVRLDKITFISSDSGSAQNFLEMEDGFAAYAASKAALNQALRHMAAEVKRRRRPTVILALHPGEVKTDMANIDVDWEVEGQMTPQESVEACLRVIDSKGSEDNGTFWTWENRPYPW